MTTVRHPSADDPRVMLDQDIGVLSESGTDARAIDMVISGGTRKDGGGSAARLGCGSAQSRFGMRPKALSPRGNCSPRKEGRA